MKKFARFVKSDWMSYGMEVSRTQTARLIADLKDYATANKLDMEVINIRDNDPSQISWVMVSMYSQEHDMPVIKLEIFPKSSKRKGSK